LFAETAKKYMDGITIIEKVATGLVPLIEAGQINSNKMTSLLKEYINPMLEKNIDYLVLGCTHYPFLIPQITILTGDNIRIIDSGRAVAKQAKTVLISKKTACSYSKTQASHKIYSNTNTKTIKMLLANYKLNYDLITEDF
jgi:glutamate racemase